MKKEVLLPVLAILSILMLAACGGNGPEKTVDNFMKSYKDLKLEEASKHVSTELEGEYKETLEEESDGVALEDIKAVKGLTKELKYEITEENVDGNTAEVKIELTYADASEPLATSIGEIFGQLFGLAFTAEEMTEDEANEMLMEMLLTTVTKNLENYEIKTENTNGVIKLAKENDEWVITELDENATNALVFGLVTGLEDFNPFGDMDGEIEVEFNADDIEFNEDINVKNLDEENAE